MNTTQKIRYIANHYGFENQSRQLMEECGELAQAANKMWRATKEFVCGDGKSTEVISAENNLVEEMADVWVMIWQLQELLGISNKKLSDTMDIKLDREIDRIKKEQEKSV